MAITRLTQSTLQQAFPKYPNAWDGVTAVSSMDAISAIALTSSQNSIEFNSIPQTYQHLQIRYSANIDAIAGGNFQFNADNSELYRNHYLVGDGTNANSYADAGANVHAYGSIYGQGYNGGSSTFASGIIEILDYNNTNKFKVCRSLIGIDRNGSGAIQLVSTSWRSTAAINAIKFFAEGTSVFTSNTNISLYGIK